MNIHGIPSFVYCLSFIVEETRGIPLSDQPIEKPIIIKQPSSMSAQTGRSVKLECQATGCPSPKYQWHKMGCSADGKLEPYPVKDQMSSELYVSILKSDGFMSSLFPP